MEKKPNRVSERESCGRPVLHVHDGDSRPSWRRYGSGVANLEATVEWLGQLSLRVEETAFAGVGDKRDVTRGGWMTLDKPAALALRDFLNRNYPESDK